MATQRYDWRNVIFLTSTPVIALTAIPIYLMYSPWQWKFLFWGVLFYLLTSMSITAGYHRYLAHKAYEGPAWLRLVYLLFGAASFQGSALQWCTDHRRHHLKVDTDDDPYSINKGFFFAHFGWLMLKNPYDVETIAPKDLKKDPLIMWQHKYYNSVAIGMGFGVPFLIGLFSGSPWGMLLFAGVARTVLVHHFTFFINSACHTFGRQTYQDENTGKDNWLMAFFTSGEGYHNYHHKFERDYRNGIRWYDWDPTKWLIGGLNKIGVTHSLYRVSPQLILQARMRMDEKHMLQTSRLSPDTLASLKVRIEQSMEKMRVLRMQIQQSRLKARQTANEKLANFRSELQQLRVEYKLAKMEFKRTFAQWKRLRYAAS